MPESEFHARTTNKNENVIIQFQKHANHEIHKIPRQNNENYENLIIPCNKKKTNEIPRIPIQN